MLCFEVCFFSVAQGYLELYQAAQWCLCVQALVFNGCNALFLSRSLPLIQIC